MADKYANKAKESRRKHGKERCGQKKSFLDRQDAFLHNRGQRPYRCTYCSGWHLASYKVHKAKFSQTMAL